MVMTVCFGIEWAKLSVFAGLLTNLILGDEDDKCNEGVEGGN